MVTGLTRLSCSRQLQNPGAFHALDLGRHGRTHDHHLGLQRPVQCPIALGRIDLDPLLGGHTQDLHDVQPLVVHILLVCADPNSCHHFGSHGWTGK